MMSAISDSKIIKLNKQVKWERIRAVLISYLFTKHTAYQIVAQNCSCVVSHWMAKLA